jgi:hypothetical protein
LDDFYRENFESVTHEGTSATASTAASAQRFPLLNADACSSSEMLVSHKGRFDAIDSEFDIKDEAFATVSTTQSVTNVARFNDQFFPPLSNAQQNAFHHAANQPIATFPGTSADSCNDPVAGHSYNAFTTRPHYEPVRPLHDLYSTGPLVGGGAMPLVNNS